MKGYSVVKSLEVPYVALRTLFEGNSEVRLYENEVTGDLRVGKRIDLWAVEGALDVNEVEAMQGVSHPNIVEVIDVLRVLGYEAPMNVVEIIMPFLQLGSVFDAFERGEQVSLAGACRLAQGALLGLAHMHEVLGLLHRDVKSPNLFLNDDATTLLVGDLGIAAKLDDDGEAPTFAGVHPYIPPEAHVSARIGRAADIYGLGLVLFELTSRPMPYEQYTTDGLASRLERGWPAPRPRDLAYWPQVPGRLRRVINKAIRKNPASRFQTAAAMSQALASVPLIDWSLAADDTDFLRWEGASVQRPERLFRVEAQKKKRGSGWRISGLQYVTTWRRVVQDVTVGDPVYDTSTSAIFESLLHLSTSR